MRAAIDDGLLTAAHDISDGGLAVALAEMSIGHGIGANITADGDAAFWFGEDQARYILVVETDDAVALEARAGDLPLTRIGTSGGTHLQFADKVTISVAELHDLNEGWFPALMQG